MADLDTGVGSDLDFMRLFQLLAPRCSSLPTSSAAVAKHAGHVTVQEPSHSAITPHLPLTL